MKTRDQVRNQLYHYLQKSPLKSEQFFDKMCVFKSNFYEKFYLGVRLQRKKADENELKDQVVLTVLLS